LSVSTTAFEPRMRTPLLIIGVPRKGSLIDIL